MAIVSVKKVLRWHFQQHRWIYRADRIGARAFNETAYEYFERLYPRPHP